MFAATIPVGDPEAIVSLLGARDQHLRKICDLIHVDISARDGKLHVRGEEAAVAQATEVLEHLKQIVDRRGSVAPEQVDQTIIRVTGGVSPGEIGVHVIDCPGRQVIPRTPGQRGYIKAMRENDLVFCAGPAGSGKTYLAVAMAVEALKRKQMKKIVLVRPAVEAGERLGYLPGDLQAKLNPYLRPLLDALREMMDYDQIKKYSEQDVIEMVPLAYMRGRTLNEAFIILDEAQNTTVAQMKMFLTRMGLSSKIVVSGDPTQVDLPPHTRSGMADALHRLRDIKGFARVQLSNADIVRHRLVQDVVRAYEEGPKKRK
ncbi:MAG: PhoH family protein [Planctomycetales bacterium]|nr:PhoH family protein [Planctomycetales bacterium]